MPWKVTAVVFVAKLTVNVSTDNEYIPDERTSKSWRSFEIMTRGGCVPPICDCSAGAPLAASFEISPCNGATVRRPYLANGFDFPSHSRGLPPAAGCDGAAAR